MVVLEWITLTVNIIRANLGMPADLGEPKAVKAWLLAFLHVINGRVQKDEASFSCCTNSSSNLALVTVGIRVSVWSHLQEI